MNLIEAYRYLAALEQHRHFGRAAQACHITQPALSNALRALEAHYDVAIVRRGRQYEGLTPEGEQVLATAHRILREQEALQQALAGSAENPRGGLVIGAVPTAVPIAARFAARLVERHPGIVPEVRSLASQEIETGLDTLGLDLGLGYTDRLDRTRGALQAWPQYVEHYHLLRRVAHGGPTLHFGVPLRWADAAKHPLCMLSPEMHNRSILDRVFRDLGLDIRPVFETNSVMALLAAVQSSHRLVAVLPGALVSTVTAQGGLEALPLVDPDVRTPIGFMSSSTGRASHALAAALRLATDAAWLAEAAAHSGPLRSSVDTEVE